MDDRMLSRRGALKLFGAAALGVATSSQLVDRASAGRGWCYADPLFKIGNYVFDVSLASDLRMLTSATGPVKITLYVPTKVNALHLLSDLGFGRGYDVSIVKTSTLSATTRNIAVRVVVNAPAKDSSLPVTVRMTSLLTSVLVSQSTASGYANKSITWNGNIKTISLLDSLIQL
jgi:hypothetical protein